MRLNIQQQHIVTGGSKPIEKIEYKTTSNSKIVQVLTSGLYIRPINAIVRELCTNALDSHIMADKANEPFTVTLPNVVNPWFIVRDYGTSMTKDVMFNIYGVLGESTKTDGNGQIGGWGLGGKSPMAYTPTFFITTFLNGRRCIYQSSCLDATNPLELLLDGPTDEPDGVEVKLPIQSKDCSRFIEAAKREIAAFDVKPEIKGIRDALEYSYTLENPESIQPTLILPDNTGKLCSQTLNVNYYFTYSPELHTVNIRMGCVMYKLNTQSEFYDKFKRQFSKLQYFVSFQDLVFDLPVDSVDVKPSREDLDYTDRTVDVITGLLETVIKKYKKEMLTWVCELRNKPVDDALQEIANSDLRYHSYVLEKYGRVCPLLKKWLKYSHILPARNSEILNSLKETLPNTYTQLAVFATDTEKVKKYSKAKAVIAYNFERKFSMYLRGKLYLKRFKYAHDEGLLDPSYMQRYRQNKSYLGYESYYICQYATTKHLAVTENDFELLKNALSDFFDEFTLEDLPEIPKAVKQAYSSTRNPTEIKYTTIDSGYETKIMQCSYSIKSLKEIQDKYPDYLFCIQRKGHYRPYSNHTIADFAKMFNRKFVIVNVTDSLYDNAVASTRIDVVKAESYFPKLWYTLTEAQQFNLMDLAAQYRINNTIRCWHSNNAQYYESLSKIPLVKEWFFGFVPNHTLTNTEVNLIDSLAPTFVRKYAQREAKKIQDRINYRVNLMLKKYPVMQLITWDTPPHLIIELLCLTHPQFKEELSNAIDTGTETENC